MRAAVIYSIEQKEANEFFVFDTMNLLAPHRDALRQHFKEIRAVQQPLDDQSRTRPAKISLDFGNLRSEAAQSQEVFYQAWFIEIPLTYSQSLAEQWLNYVPGCMEEVVHPRSFLKTGSGQRTVEHLAYVVVRETIMRHLFPRTTANGWRDLEIVLNSLLEIARFKEEHKSCSGQIAVYDSTFLQNPDYPLKEVIRIEEYKRIRKLLAATGKNFCLIADKTNVTGFHEIKSLGGKPLIATFHNGIGSLKMGKQNICRFSNGNFQATSIGPPLANFGDSELFSQLEEMQYQELRSLLNTAITDARANGFGCTIVIDFGNVVETKLKGHHLGKPFKISEADKTLFTAMCSIDGAVHINAQTCQVLAFGCLLDGLAVDDEDLSKGARHNSAIRYSSINTSVAVIVVSEDGPVTIFEGKPVTKISRYVDDDSVPSQLPTLGEWLRN